MEDAAESGVIDNAKSSDKVLLRQAMIAELDAVSLYEQMAASTTNAKLKKIFLHVAEEEKVHVGEFERMLDMVDDKHDDSVNDGRAEAEQNTK